MLTLIAIGICVVGVVLITLGVRGRRIGDDPHCASCGFDLHGLAIDSARECDTASTCPECGARLDHPDATRIGELRRRPRAIWSGSLTIAVGLAFIFFAAQPGAVGAWVQARLPTWLVMAQADLGSGYAAEELTHRWGGNKLSVREISRAGEIAVSALERSPTVRAGWTNLYGETLRSGTLTPEQQRRFILATVQIEQRFRSRVYPGDPIPFRIEYCAKGDTDLLAESGAQGWKTDLISVRVGNIEHDFTGSWTTSPLRLGGGGISASTWSSLSQKPVALEPGVHDASHIITFSIDGISARFEHTQRIEVVPRGTPVVELDTDPSVGKSISASLELVTPKVSPMPPSPGEARIRVRLRARGLPIPIAGDMIWRIDGTETKVGTFVMVPASTDSQSLAASIDRSLPPEFPPPGVRSLDVILRPSADIAMRRTIVDRIWGEDIVFVGVPIQQVEPLALRRWSGSDPGIRPADTAP